jgi:hypothetical protein
VEGAEVEGNAFPNKEHTPLPEGYDGNKKHG